MTVQVQRCREGSLLRQSGEPFGERSVAAETGRKRAAEECEEEGGEAEAGIEARTPQRRAGPGRPRRSRIMEPVAVGQGEACPSTSSYGLCPASRESLLPGYVDVATARKSRVMRAPGLLTAEDLALIADVHAAVLASEDQGTNNPQNREHDRKVCTFLNRDPGNPIRNMAPRVLSKLLRFADRAWSEAAWGGDDDRPGPLHEVRGGVRSLSIRVVEHWEYSVGGALVDPWHYDPGSVVTIVGLLCDGFEGGVFRTHEDDGEQLEHPMEVGDVICFVSHKYHNVTPVTAGTRRSIVMELWEGGLPFAGRRPPTQENSASQKPQAA